MTAGFGNLASKILDLAAKGATVKDITDHVTGGGYGGPSQNAQNIGNLQKQTPYSGTGMATGVQGLADQDQQTAFGLSTASKLYDQALNNADRQSAFNNLAAINDMSNRATAANNVLNAYQNARASNQQFLASLNNVGRSVGAY